MSYFLVIKHLKVNHANVLTSNYAVTATPLMAITLFGHALGANIDAKNTGVAVIHHNTRFLSESDRRAGFKKRLFQQRKAATYIDKNDYSKDSLSLSLQPIATAHLFLSLVLEFQTRPDVDRIMKFLQGGRISGGVIESHGQVAVFHEHDDAFIDSLPGNGYWLLDRKDLIDPDQPSHSLVNALGSTQESWLTPVVAGYALTTQPISQIKGVRSLPDGSFVDHAFVEPLLGLAQYVSIRQYSDFEIPFWRNSWKSDTLFIASIND